MTEQQIDTIVKHFIIAAIWADCPEGTRPRETKAAIQGARNFVTRFVTRHVGLTQAALACDGYGSHPDAGSPEASFGHDLYLTSAGHGAGFNDRTELGIWGEKLSDVIRAEWREWHCEVTFYRGWLYLEGSSFKAA